MEWQLANITATRLILVRMGVAQSQLLMPQSLEQLRMSLLIHGPVGPVVIDHANVPHVDASTVSLLASSLVLWWFLITLAFTGFTMLLLIL